MYFSVLCTKYNVLTKHKKHFYQNITGGQVWWCIPAIPAFGRLRQEDHHEFEASLKYRDPVSKTVTTTTATNPYCQKPKHTY